MTTLSTTDRPLSADLGRRVLRADGLLCTVFGAVLAAGCVPIAALLGVEAPLAVAALGAGTLLWGLRLLQLSAPARYTRRALTVALVANLLWVAVSAAVLIAGIPALSPLGVWAVAATADLVVAVALAQGYARWRSR